MRLNATAERGYLSRDSKQTGDANVMIYQSQHVNHASPLFRTEYAARLSYARNDRNLWTLQIARWKRGLRKLKAFFASEGWGRVER